MSIRHLSRKLRQTSTNEFDPISAFEANSAPSISDQIPEDRISQPKANYTYELSLIEKENLTQSIEKLNIYQQQAIFSSAQNTLLSAMVGSGKTTVLTQKVLYLHFVKKVPLSQMAVLTFTNKAAREIKERIASFYQNTIPDKEEMRYFGTFHSIARQINKEHPLLEKLGFTPEFSILDQETKDDFLQRLIVSNALDVKYANKLDKRIHLYRKEKQLLYANMKNEDDLPQLLKLAQKEKQSNNVMDFDDLLSVCNWLLQKEKNFLPQWIIVDEFQDCNQEQMLMIENMSNSDTHFFAVGDPNQSIYTWRGSNASIFKKMVDDPSFEIIQLPLNYRTSGQLLNAAACLLQKENQNLEATRSAGQKLRIVNHFDDHQEAHYYTKKFREIHKNGTAWKEIAILVRTRQQLDIFQSIFQKEDIPCEIVSKQNLREQVALFWLQKILTAALHPNDLDSILAVFCSKEFGFLKTNKRIYTAFLQFYNPDLHSSKLEGFVEWMKEKHKNQTNFIQLGERLLKLPYELQKEFDCYTYLQLDSFLKPTSVHFLEYKEQIQSALEEIKQYAHKNYYGDHLQIYQAAMSLVNLEGHFQINSGIQEKKDGIQLLTIHAAKGLEFDYVFLSGANTGIIPLDRKKEGYDYLKEEKRLLFVALTRARNHMEISWHTQSHKWNAQEGPSYFLNSIPSHLVEKEEKKKTKDVPNTENQASTSAKWSKGSKVKHPKYGEGVVLSCNEKEVVCEFGKFGEKSFALAWCNLETL